MNERRRYPPDASVAWGTGGGGRRGASAAEPRGEGMAERRAAEHGGAEGERRKRGGRAAHTQRRAAERRHSIADGTALHRGRVGSRHFEESLSSLRLSFFVLYITCVIIIACIFFVQILQNKYRLYKRIAVK